MRNSFREVSNLPKYGYVCSVPQSNSLWPRGLEPARLRCPWVFSGKNTSVDCHFFFQGIFPTQGSYTHLLYTHMSGIGRQILYHCATLGAQIWVHLVSGRIIFKLNWVKLDPKAGAYSHYNMPSIPTTTQCIWPAGHRFWLTLAQREFMRKTSGNQSMRPRR